MLEEFDDGLGEECQCDTDEPCRAFEHDAPAPDHDRTVLSRQVFVCGGDERPGSRGTDCPDSLHDHPTTAPGVVQHEVPSVRAVRLDPRRRAARASGRERGVNDEPHDPRPAQPGRWRDELHVRGAGRAALRWMPGLPRRRPRRDVRVVTRCPESPGLTAYGEEIRQRIRAAES